MIVLGFTPYRQYSSHVTAEVNDRLWNFDVTLAALSSLVFYETQRNGLLRAKGLLSLTRGTILTSHPTDIKMNDQMTKIV